MPLLYDPQGRAAITLAGKTLRKNTDGFFDVPDSHSRAAKIAGLVDAEPFIPKPSPEPTAIADPQPAVKSAEKPAQPAPVADKSKTGTN